MGERTLVQVNEISSLKSCLYFPLPKVKGEHPPPPHSLAKDVRETFVKINQHPYSNPSYLFPDVPCDIPLPYMFIPSDNFRGGQWLN